jgi:uncharacterized protein
MTALDPRLLDMLVCPLTRGKLLWDAANQRLISPDAGLAYPVRDGVPIMLPEEAESLDDGAVQSASSKLTAQQRRQ